MPSLISKKVIENYWKYQEKTTLIFQCKSLLGQLYDGYDEEYDCPILDEDRVSTILLIKYAFKKFNRRVDLRFFF